MKPDRQDPWHKSSSFLPEDAAIFLLLLLLVLFSLSALASIYASAFGEIMPLFSVRNLAALFGLSLR